MLNVFIVDRLFEIYRTIKIRIVIGAENKRSLEESQTIIYADVHIYIYILSFGCFRLIDFLNQFLEICSLDC